MKPEVTVEELARELIKIPEYSWTPYGSDSYKSQMAKKLAKVVAQAILATYKVVKR